ALDRFRTGQFLFDAKARQGESLLAERHLHDAPRTGAQFAGDDRTFQKVFRSRVLDFGQGIGRSRDPDNFILVKWADLDFTATAWSFHQPQLDPLVEQQANDQVGVSLYHIACDRSVLGLEPDENFR